MEQCMTGPIWFLKYAMVECDGVVVDPIKARVADIIHGGARA
jgi:hypothetical protein